MILVTWQSRAVNINRDVISEGTGIFLQAIKSPNGTTKVIIIPIDSDVPVEVSLEDVRFPNLMEGRKHIKRAIKRSQNPKMDTNFEPEERWSTDTK